MKTFLQFTESGPRTVDEAGEKVDSLGVNGLRFSEDRLRALASPGKKVPTKVNRLKFKADGGVYVSDPIFDGDSEEFVESVSVSDELREENQVLNELLADTQSELSTVRAERDTLSSQVNGHKGNATKLKNQIEGLTKALEESSNRIDELENQLAEVPTDGDVS